MTEQECLSLVKKEYKESKPIIIADIGDFFYVDLRINEMADFHSVNKKTKEVSGNIPTMKVLNNDQIREQIEERVKKKMNT